MNDTLKLIETRTINDALVNGYYGKKEAWFTRDEIGSVLGYADPRQSIANIHNRHKERFSDKSVQINLICTDGKSYDTTVYNFKGVMEICRWSKQPKADMVMVTVMLAFAEYERDMIVERTSMGKAMKREHDPDWREGRKLKEIDNEQFEKLAQKQKDGLITVADCCRELGISRSTWYDRSRKVG